MEYRHHTPLLKAHVSMQKRGEERLDKSEVVDDFKNPVFFRHNGDDAQMNTQKLQQHAQYLYNIKPNKNHSMASIPIPAKKEILLLGKSVFCNEVTLSVSTKIQGRPHSK